MARPKIIIDTDAGMDDAVAIFMALRCHIKGSVEVIALTTVQGNTSVKNVNVNVLRILQTMQLLKDIPVYEGSSTGLVHYFDYTQGKYHGLDGFGDATYDTESPSTSVIQSEHAAVALTRLAREHKGSIHLAAIGPLTNIALAMRLDPDFTSNLASIYIMGGNYQGEGNHTVSAEFNFVSDPESAKVVLDETKKIIKLVPWETCLYNVHISFQMRHKLGEYETSVAALLNKIEEYSLAKTNFKHWINCDQICLAWMLDDLGCLAADSDITKKLPTRQVDCYATVELNGTDTRGQMVVDKRNKKKKISNVCYLTNLDEEIYRKYLKLVFSGDF